MIGTRLSDRFELTGELGRGGMGVVFRARDPVLGREVAVKTVALGDSPEAHEERFRREAQVVAGLDHPGIVPIFDFGRHEDFLYFVMPLVSGKTLHDLIAADALPLGETLEIVAQVAEALDYSSSRGVVHRDVKPENVMVTGGGAAPRARIMDFGLALPATGSRITKSGQLPGTLAYLSPEYILSLDLDGRSDLYSLGTILYECLAGEPPFTGAQGSVLFRIVHEEPPTLGVDERLAAIVMRCLAKEPQDRPASGAELAALLRGYRETLSEHARESLPVAPELRLLQARRSQAAPLVGRTRELAELTRRLDAALAGECQLVLLGGEAGIGKTRLLLELELRARARGVRVVTGRFSSHQGTFPHHGLCELIQDFFRGRTELDGREGPELGDLAGELLGRFPVLAEIEALREAAGEGASAPAHGTASGDPTLVFELLARTLIRLAAGRPVVMLLENLQAAETSIEALGYLVRRASPTPTLVVGAYRPAGLSRRHGITRLARGFAGDPRFARILLEPLPPDEHRELVLSLLESSSGVSLRLEEDLAARLYEATEGNPFFTRELLRSLLDAQDISRDATGSWVLAGESALATGTLPETIQQAVEARLERLEDGLLRTLKTASVLGRSFAMADLKWVVGDAEQAEEAVDALLEAGILEEDRRAKGDVMAFASGVVRDVLHGALTRRRRRSLHRRYAARLEERHAGRLERVYPQLVHHFSEGDEAVKAVTYALMLARMSAGAFSPADTVRATRTALSFVEDEDLDDSGEVEGELRLLLAGALRTAGNIAGALSEAGRAVRVFAERGEGGPAAAACLVAAETAWQSRRVEETRRWLVQGIDAARAAAARRQLRQLLTLAATVANLRGEHQQGRAWLEEAETLAAGGRGGDVLPSGGVLISALSNPPTTEDPVAGVCLEDAEVLGNVFDPLLGYDAEGNLVPRLCEGFEDSAAGTELTLFLRRDVRFSDGMPLTAREVKRSIESSARRSAGHPVAAFAALAGMRAYLEGRAAEVSGVEVLAGERIRFRLRERLPIFPALLTDLKTAMARETDGRLVGTGPFRIASIRHRRIVLERNPRDWRPAPSLLDGIEMRVFPDARSIAAGLRAGDLDLGRDLSPDDLDEVLKDPNLRGGLLEAPKKNVYFVLFNLAGPAARRPEVRRALAHSVRAQDLVWRTVGRFAQPAACLIPPGILGHDPGRQRPFLSHEAAIAALRETGEALPLALRAAAHPLLADRYGSLIEALLEEWRAVGVEVEVESSSIEAYLEAFEDCRRLDLMIMRWVPDYDDPDNLTHVLFNSRDGLLRCYMGSGGASQQLDELLVQARHERDRSRRRVLYRRIENRLAEDNVLLPLFHDIDYRIAGPRVKGLRHLSSPPWVNYSRLGKEAPGTGAPGIGPPGAGAPARAPATAARQVPHAALRVPLPGTFDSLEPALALFIEPAEVVPNVFETLTRVGEGARIEPCLASGYEMKDGGRRMQLTLRDGVRFHDGRRLTARDVRYSFERLLRSRYAGVDTALMPVRGARDFHAGRRARLTGLEIHSATELEIHLSEPLGFFPAMLSNPMTVIVPEGADDFTGNWRTGCAGTGPFRVVGFLAGERIELEANPDYWHPGVPKCRRLVFELGVEPRHVRAAFRSGELSIASSLRPEDVEALRREADYVQGFRESPGFSTYFLVPNSCRGPFTDPARRRALAAAIDVEAILRATLGPLGLPARGLISPGLLGHEARPLRRRRMPSSSAGLAGLSVEVSLHAAYTGQYAHVWRQLASALAATGVAANVIDGPMSEMLERIKRGDVDLAAARRIAAYPDSDAFVSLFHSADGLLGQLLDNREIDRLIEGGRRETDPTLRHAIYRELEQVLERDALLIPLFDEQIYCFARSEVQGLRIRFGWPKVAYEELSLEY